MKRREIVVGSRGSQLALIQAGLVVASLKEAYPDVDFAIRKITTSGDRDQRTSLERMSTIGVFVKELEEALLDKRADLAVHSLKDMPTLVPAGLCLAGVMERSDPRDVLVSRGEQLKELASGSRIGTDSQRRSIQVARCRPDLKTQSIRGNVDTRLSKVDQGEVDALITAAAAMIRLNLEEKITQYLPVDDFLPSVGQGTLAIEIRQADEAVIEMVSRINHTPSWQCALAERAFLSTLGGGCRAPIAALATIANGQMNITGMAASEDGKEMLKASAQGEATSPEKLGQELARELLNMGALRFIEEVRSR